MSEPRLSQEGFRFREALAEAGFEVTPDQLAGGVIEADKTIRPGPDGRCVNCGNRHRKDDPSISLDFRCGLCDECAFYSED